MGIQLTAKKGKLIIPDGYVMVANTTMTKYWRPVSNPDTGEYESEPAVQYIGRAQLFFDYDERMSSSGVAVAQFAFNFTHSNGLDPVHECYAHIHAAGLDGWILNGMVDLL